MNILGGLILPGPDFAYGSCGLVLVPDQSAGVCGELAGAFRPGLPLSGTICGFGVAGLGVGVAVGLTTGTSVLAALPLSVMTVPLAGAA